MDDTQKPDTVPERDVETTELDTGKFNPDLRDKLKSYNNTYTSNERRLVLHFPVQVEPTIVEVKGTITIGRPDLRTGVHPTIDLTIHNGAALGVSRFHAEIAVINGVFHIKDMGSTNGTRINDRKVDPYRFVPFRSGDTLRFGYLHAIVG